MHKLATSLLIAGTVVGAAFSQSALAEEASLSANVGLYSQYVFRGLAQTNEDPAIQGGFDYSHPSGIYLGVWGSNISWLKENATTSSTSVAGSYTTGGTLEMDFYGGYKGAVGDWSYDLGLLQYYYPGTVTSPNIKANTLEAYGAVGYKWFSAKYSHAISNEVFGVKDASGTYYLDLAANFPIADSGFTAGVHYGIQKYSGTDSRNTNGATNDDLFSYNDYKLSLTYDMGKSSKLFENTTVGIAYTDTSGVNKCGYGAYSDTDTAKGAACTGVFPKNVARGKTTVWISRSF